MKENRFLMLLLLCVTSIFAQIKGKVVDENNQPIPYVNIGVQNEALGTSSNEDGSFYLPLKEIKNLVFSALGYEKRIIKSNEVEIVKLKSTVFTLNEVVVLDKKQTNTIEIGISKGIAQAFENGPKMDARFFPYTAKVKKNRYIKQVSLFTENSLENATVKVHFYASDSVGMPGKELVEKDILIQVKKGSRRTYFDISKYNITFPKKGLFVAIERLFIEKNKFTKDLPTPEEGKTKKYTVYYPLLFYNYTVKDFYFTFYGGSWHKESKKTNDPSIENRVFEPAITLILTN